jgi:hypothetical protein
VTLRVHLTEHVDYQFDRAVRKVTEDQIAVLTREFQEVGGDPAMLRFNEGVATAYRQDLDDITVRGDVLPVTWEETHPRSTMTSRAVLAHELGHAAFPETDLPPRAWNDEFRASYWAATNAPNLTREERADLLRDAISRADEAGVTIKLNTFIQEVLYGYVADP